jgi:hypothetical protein
MNVTQQELEASFQLLNDDELLRRASSGNLTELAQKVAQAEIDTRGLTLTIEPCQDDTAIAEPDFVGHGDLLILTRYLSPTEAYLLEACLEAEGIPSMVTDAHLIQANELLSVALGGARVLVPESHFEQAQAVFTAFKAGEYEIDDNDDNDDSEPSG